MRRQPPATWQCSSREQLAKVRSCCCKSCWWRFQWSPASITAVAAAVRRSKHSALPWSRRTRRQSSGPMWRCPVASSTRQVWSSGRKTTSVLASTEISAASIDIRWSEATRKATSRSTSRQSCSMTTLAISVKSDQVSTVRIVNSIYDKLQIFQCFVFLFPISYPTRRTCNPLSLG